MVTNACKRVVASGYDRIAEQYCAWASGARADERANYTAILLNHVPRGADVLDLGCGAGVPTTRTLAQHYRVTGVDLAARHVAMARTQVPNATFLHADMTELRFAPRSFDAVAAFYSLLHVPRNEQPPLLRRIARWLRPDGLLVATMWPDAQEALCDDWFGAPMYWSGLDTETSKRVVRASGLTLLGATQETRDEFGESITFLWIVAQRCGRTAAFESNRGCSGTNDEINRC